MKVRPPNPTLTPCEREQLNDRCLNKGAGSEHETPTPCENHRRNPNDGEPEIRDNHEHGNKHTQARGPTQRLGSRPFL